jgi:hypothetical protein
MPNVTVLYTDGSKPSEVVEKVNQRLQWYDIVKKEMIVLYGGRLDFEYKEDPYLVKMGEVERKRRGLKSTFRLLPKAVDMEVKVKQSTSDEAGIKKMINDYLEYNDTKVSVVEENKEGIVLEVPEEEVEDFAYECERNGFAIETRE